MTDLTATVETLRRALGAATNGGSLIAEDWEAAARALEGKEERRDG